MLQKSKDFIMHIKYALFYELLPQSKWMKKRQAKKLIKLHKDKYLVCIWSQKDYYKYA
jgi:hypothetical protein